MDKKIILRFTDNTLVEITDKDVINTFRFARYGVEYNIKKSHFIVPYPSVKLIERVMV